MMDAGWQVRPVHVASMNHFAAAANPGQQGDCWPAPLNFLDTVFTLSAASPQGDTHHTRARPRELLPRPPPRSIKAADAKLARPERSGELVNPQASPAAALATLSARAVFLFCFVLKGLGRVPIEVSREAPPAATSRDVWRREGRPFWGPPRWLLRRCVPGRGRDQGWPRSRPAGRRDVAAPLQGQGRHPRFAGSFQPDPLTGTAGPDRRYHRHRSGQSANPRRLPTRVPGSQRPGHHSWGPAHPVRYGHLPGPGKTWRTPRGRRVKPGRPKWRC